MNRSGFSSFTSRRPAVVAAALAAAGLALAACGTNSGSSSGSGTTSSSAASGKAASSASVNSGTSGNGAVAGSSLFPAAVGYTWVYDDTVGAEKGTGTNRVVAVRPTADGQQVTMTNSEDLVGFGTTKTTTDTLIFHSDGTISIPLTQVGTTAVTVKSGSILWPSAAGLAAGQSRASTIVVAVNAGGQATTVTVHVLVTSGGSATVMVPAGTYQTTLINETMTEQFEGVPLKTEIQNWDASGVGPVKSDVITTADGHSTTVSAQELKSFTKG
jgi:hypothetical protein